MRFLLLSILLASACATANAKPLVAAPGGGTHGNLLSVAAGSYTTANGAEYIATYVVDPDTQLCFFMSDGVAPVECCRLMHVREVRAALSRLSCP
jgi:hypothetical protein